VLLRFSIDVKKGAYAHQTKIFNIYRAKEKKGRNALSTPLDISRYFRFWFFAL